jgi:BirA family biotin operon repressor/biotin-[acetyl-CoA-carboxylase] ligase
MPNGPDPVVDPLLPIGHSVVRLTTVDSTNTYAAEKLALGELRHGTVIVAREQTGGKGQRGRSWKDIPGLDLLASVVLVPAGMPVMSQFELGKAAALAVHDVVSGALRAADRDVSGARIKWPNDVLVDDRKIAGILIENEVRGERVASSIIGIGINVNSTDLERNPNATSLRTATGGTHGLDAILKALCERLQYWLGRVGKDGRPVASAYIALLWTKDRFTEFILDGQAINARPLDVDDQGRLIVEDEAGHVAAYGMERLRHKVHDGR